MQKKLHNTLSMIKKINLFVIFFIIFLIDGRQVLYADAVSVIVPKKYLIEKASLVVYILDKLGDQCIGTCQLHEAFEQRNILQQDLFIQKESAMIQLTPDVIELPNFSQPKDNDVVLHIEFDNDIRVLKVLIVKDSLLEDKPFDVISISVGECVTTDDFDDLVDLIDGIDSSAMKSNCSVDKNYLLNKYMLYAKIYCMMQYKHAKHKIQDMTAWLCNKI